MRAVAVAVAVAVSTAHGAEQPQPKPTFHPTLAAASEVAAADQSLVLLDFSADWCGPCNAMKKDTFPAKEFVAGAGAVRIVVVDVDANQQLAQSFNISAIPALALLTPDGKIVSRRTGYVDAPELVAWIKEGRERVKRGEWEGISPGSKLGEFTKKAATDGLDTNDFKRLVAMLGDPEPSERISVAKLLTAQREAAVPWLIDAVADPYLGVRVSASDLLQRMATKAPLIDPWQSPAELTETVAVLKSWWAGSGKLPPPTAPRTVDATTAATIQASIDSLRSGDTVRRTEAMSALVGHGMEALPSLRTAIKRYERENPRLLALLEDVRWAILVPDAVDRRVGGVRQSLARWSSTERQDAATRLRRAGRDAVPALAELASDADALVVENAVRALAEIGGQDVIPAMAALLKAQDPNLRMTAAQALGKTKNAEATAPLLGVVSDENEIVACTALMALNEVHSKESTFNPSAGAKETLTTNLVDALGKCLVDPRWRVRAAAAEVAGKLRVNQLSTNLTILLTDPDPFVVKNTLVALGALREQPKPEKLAALANRLPALRGEAVEMLAQSESDETVPLVQSMYDGGDSEVRLTILNTLARVEPPNANNRTNDTWMPLIRKAAVEKEPRLRQAAAELIGRRPPGLAAQMIGPLLADDDNAVRETAAEIALSIIAGERRVASKYGINRYAADADEMVYASGSRAPARAGKTNKPPVSAEQLRSWHEALAKKTGGNPDLGVAAALFATGDGKKDLPLLASALEKLDEKGVRRLAASPALGLILAKLPWPEGKAVVEEFCATPALFALATVESEKASAPVMAFLREPARFLATVERAADDDLKSMLQQLLGGSSPVYGTPRKTWSLLGDSEKNKPLVTALLESTNAAWRGAAIYAMGRWTDGADTNVLEKALLETNGWVRGAAAQALARILKDRSALEGKLGPLIADEHGYPRRVAALALLEPEIRQTAGLQWQFEYFHYEEVQTGRSDGYSASDARPLTALETKPSYLVSARKWTTATNAEAITPFALLLAQHGELDGVERLVEIRSELLESKVMVLPDPLLTAIALTQNSKYVPLLRSLMESTRNDYELRKVLRALKGMTGAEARQLRVEVNKRMRGAASGMSVE